MSSLSFFTLKERNLNWIFEIYSEDRIYSYEILSDLSSCKVFNTYIIFRIFYNAYLEILRLKISFKMCAKSKIYTRKKSFLMHLMNINIQKSINITIVTNGCH